MKKHTVDSLLTLATTPAGVQQIRALVAELDEWTGLMLPNYPEDLNVVRKLEVKALLKEKDGGTQFDAQRQSTLRVKYSHAIRETIYQFRIQEFQDDSGGDPIYATAIQRCIALILTLQKDQ